MKKLLLVAVMLLVASTASAMPIALDPTVTGLTVGSQTDVFNSIQFYSQTTSTPTSMTTFNDIGNIMGTKLLPGNFGFDDGDFADDWYLVGNWSDLSGYINASGYHYTSGTLNLYVTDATNYWSWGSNVGSGDDTFAFDYWVATLNLTSGTGVEGSIALNWEFANLLDGFWLDQYGNSLTARDMADQPLLLAFAHADTNNMDTTSIPGSILSDHDGSIEVGVVPEPMSMVLFGTGLVGAVLRRRFA